jgi:hypothetical protein
MHGYSNFYTTFRIRSVAQKLQHAKVEGTETVREWGLQPQITKR